jgi:hypothetical protein
VIRSSFSFLEYLGLIQKHKRGLKLCIRHAHQNSISSCSYSKSCEHVCEPWLAAQPPRQSRDFWIHEQDFLTDVFTSVSCGYALWSTQLFPMLASWVRSLWSPNLENVSFYDLAHWFWVANKMNTKYGHLLTYIRNISYLLSSQLKLRCALFLWSFSPHFL